MLLAPCTMPLLQAQDTYMNERITNNSSDVIGTARYVGMGGALGALGADMSVISWNPAGIGLFRKTDIAVTFGGTWGKSRIDEENRGKGTIDQAGFVISRKMDNDASLKYLNFAFNYQKKINFNHNFYADNYNLGGLSQMDQLAELTQFDTGQNNLAGLAIDSKFFNALTDDEGNVLTDDEGRNILYNDYASSSNIFTHHSEGSLQSFDFNLSTNLNDRAFFGLTLGIDNMRYRGWDLYGENDMTPQRNGTYDLHRDIVISGTGVNVKLGAIVRPFADNSFRVGLVIESPTWYRLRNSTLFYLNNYIKGIESREIESYLPFSIRSPWKVRTSIGSTIGRTFAWDIDYEYATYSGTSMSTREEYEDGSSSSSTKDVAMNQLTRDILRGTHTLRAGIEVNATKNLAFRVGYNLSTSAYEKIVNFNQCSLNSVAMDYATSTHFMRLGSTNILTLGVGYHAKKFYIDLAYKVRNQKGDFYAFDTGFANSVTGDPVFLKLDEQNNTNLANKTIKPVGVDLTRHAVTCTLGFKF